MSGTSLDGIDAAILETDGETVFARGEWLTLPYKESFRQQLRELLGGQGDALAIERELTLLHAEAVQALLKKSKRKVDVIGFHGQTIFHRPGEGITWQLGDGALLAEKTGIDVVCDFRRRDVAAGGQGAPLVPLYHAALLRGGELPAIGVNIGGVSNVTYVSEKEIIAFDTGPGNALIDDWVKVRTGEAYDVGGGLAASGTVQEKLLKQWLGDEFFTVKPPKSLDRNHFADILLACDAAGLSATDGAVTLTAFTAHAIAKAAEWFPQTPKAWFVAGGGAHNAVLMKMLAEKLGNVKSADALGWEGDALEAQAFAFLAVRSLRGLPLSLPTTTGCCAPVTGGALYRA